MNHSNFDVKNIITPVNVPVLQRLLRQSNYDVDKTRFLIDGFSNGFHIAYEGPTERQDSANNILIKVGSKLDMWNKIMKEVQAKRYAGPYEKISFDYFVQSPIGLVPKANNQTRLIFHLSYNFKDSFKSVNHYTPAEICSVKYNNIDYAVKISFHCRKTFFNRSSQNIQNYRIIFYSKTDLKSAFRILLLKVCCFPWLILKAYHPATNQLFFFVEKALPFGSSISCSHFQRFSNALKHIFEYQSGRPLSCCNYIDDFIFVAPIRAVCNSMVRMFISICDDLGVPVELHKTEEANTTMTFLGLQLNGTSFIITVPEEKRRRAINWLQAMTTSKKATIKELERLAGLLNFLGRAVVPSRAFTRRMYSKFSKVTTEGKLRKHHHVRLDLEFKQDCQMWLTFLSSQRHGQEGIARPYVDLTSMLESSTILQFHSNATANPQLGYGVIYETFYHFQQWVENFVVSMQPSIKFLELYALSMGVFLWSD